MRLRFTKMHGLGNDFVMLDGVSQKLSLSPAKIQKIAHRNLGIGCDQVLIVEAPHSPTADFRYRIFNASGEEVENCGNGARCFAIFVQQRGLCSKNTIVVETKVGRMTLNVRPNNLVTVDMGAPILEPEQVPFLALERALTYALPISTGDLEISAISMGNPHSVALVDKLEDFPVLEIGAEVEAHPLFPNKVNAGFMEIVSRNQAKLRVFERGVGETLACGTGACAAMVAGRIQGLFDPKVEISLPGGKLELEWRGENSHVMMTGPATTVFSGQIKI